MLGLLDSVSSISGLAGGLTGGGQSEAPSSATTTTTQNFSSGAFGGSDLTIVYVLLGLLLVAVLAGKVRV